VIETSPTDEDLMARIQKDDADAYQALFERHQQRIYGFLVRKMGNRQSADDVFQDTFLSVYRARQTWKPGRKVRPWLFSIAANAARDHGRKVRRTPEMVELNDSPTSTDQPEARLDLEAAILKLPETLREAFLLGVVEGMDHNEIADALTISPSNARARVCRARAQLRKTMRSAAP